MKHIFPLQVISSLFLLLLLLVGFQNCSDSRAIRFYSDRESLSSAAEGGGGTYDGKPMPGTYCRIFDNLSCQTQVANVQSILEADQSGIQLTADNCTSTATNFEFNNAAVTLSSLNRDFIGLSRGIFQKCDVGVDGLPAPPTQLPDAWCRSGSEDIDLVINKSLTSQNLDLSLKLRNAAGVRAVVGASLSKSVNGAETSYSSSREKFDLTITAGPSQTSRGKLNAVVDNQPVSIDVICHQANSHPTIIIERDLELHSSWINTTRLAGYWKLNEINATESTTIADSSPFAYVGKLLTGNDGLNKSDSSVKAGAVRFDGVNDSVDMLDPSDKHLDFDMRSFTYMVWIKKTGNAGSWDMPMWKGGNSSTNIGYEIECGASVCAAYISDGDGGPIGQSFVPAGFTATNGTPFIGRWVHLAAVVDRNLNQLRAYVDGSLVSTSDISAVGSVTGGEHFRIGSGLSGTSPFMGSIDDVAVWNGVLTDAEIREVVQRLKPKFF